MKYITAYIILLLATVGLAQFGPGLSDPGFVGGLNIATAAAGGGSPGVDTWTEVVENVGSSTTLAATNSGGENVVLLVSVFVGNTGRDVTSVTYAGTNMTEYIEFGTTDEMWVYYQVAPATGNNDVVVSLDGSVRHNTSALFLTNANQTTPITANGTDELSGTASKATVSSATDDLVLSFFSVASNSRTITTDGSQTEIFNAAPGSYSQAVSTEDGAASVDMDYTLSGSAQMTHVAVSVDGP